MGTGSNEMVGKRSGEQKHCEIDMGVMHMGWGIQSRADRPIPLTALGHAISGKNGTIEGCLHPLRQGWQQSTGSIGNESNAWVGRESSRLGPASSFFDIRLVHRR